MTSNHKINRKSLIFFFIAISLIITTGTLGYMLIEKSSFIDALYMTIITLSTVGYGEVFNNGISEFGKIFTIFFIMCGMSMFIYIISIIANYVIEGHLTNALRRNRMQKTISKTKKHYIICGLSNLGIQTVKEFIREKIPFVVIDLDETKIEKVQAKTGTEITYVAGNALEEQTLKKANIENAHGIISCAKEDSDNGFIILTAKEINEKIKAIAVCNNENNEKKLKKMGADRVVLPNLIGGKRIAGMVARPEVINFLDIITVQEEFQLFMEEITIEANSCLAQKMLKESMIRQETDAIVIGIKHINGQLSVNPKTTEILQENDKLIVIGEELQLEKLQKMAKNCKQ